MKKDIIILGLIASFALFMSSCHPFRERVRGHGNSIEVFTNIDARNIDKIEVDGSVDVEIVPSNDPAISITAQENIIDHIEIKIFGNVAKVSYRSNVNITTTDITKVTFFITQIKAITINGSGDAICYSGFPPHQAINLKINGSGDIDIFGINCEALNVLINGSGDLEAENIDCGNLDVSVNGSGNVDFNNFGCESLSTKIDGSGDVHYRGVTNAHSIIIKGSGDIDAYNLNSQFSHFNIYGSGNSYLKVSNALSGKISGSGSIYYKGDPLLDVISTGSGKIVKKY